VKSPADLSEAEAIAELARLAELIAAADRAYHERDAPIATRHLRLNEPALARLLGVRPVTVAKYLDAGLASASGWRGCCGRAIVTHRSRRRCLRATWVRTIGGVVRVNLCESAPGR